MERIRIEESAGGVKVDLLHPRSPGWLVAGWVIVIAAAGYMWVFALSVLGMLSAPQAALGMLMMPLGIPLTVFLAYGSFSAAWLSSGRETASVSDGLLTIRSIALGIPWGSRSFFITDVSGFRFEPAPGLNRSLTFMIALDPGSLAFDYGAHTIRFGRWLDSDDAQPALDALDAALDRSRVTPTAVAPDATRDLPKSRIAFSEKDGGVKVRMPFGNTQVNRRLYGMVFGGLLLAMPMASMPSRLAASAAGDTPALGVWWSFLLILPVLAVIAPIVALSLASKEVASLSKGALVLTAKPVLLTMVRARRFDVRYIHNLRYEQPAAVMPDYFGMWSRYMRSDDGQIAFGYGAEQHRFARYVHAPEAREIADRLNAALAKDSSAGTLASAAYEAGVGSLG